MALNPKIVGASHACETVSLASTSTRPVLIHAGVTSTGADPDQVESLRNPAGGTRYFGSFALRDGADPATGTLLAVGKIPYLAPEDTTWDSSSATLGYIWVPLSNAAGPGITSVAAPTQSTAATTVTYDTNTGTSAVSLWYVPGCVTEVTVLTGDAFSAAVQIYGFFCG